MAMMGKIRRKRFGEILVAEKLITPDQVEEALEIQRAHGDSLGNILLDLGYISETDIVKALSIQYQIPFLTTNNYEVDAKLVKSFKKELLYRHNLLPFDKVGNLLLLLATDIPTKDVMASVQKCCRSDIAIYLGTSTDVFNALMEIIPAASEEIQQYRRRGQAGRQAPQTGAPEQAGPETNEISLDSVDFSSEKILSSLDAAWDSIFEAKPQEQPEEEPG